MEVKAIDNHKLAPTKQVRLSGRDWNVLAFIGRVRIISQKDLGVLLGNGQPLAARTVRGVIARWERGGYVERAWVTHGPSSITLSQHAKYQLGLPTEWAVGVPAWTQIPHTLATASVAVRYQTGFVESGVWSHPRSFETSHLVDGVVETPDGFIAVEVELNRKSSERWKHILTTLAYEWDRIHYWVAPTIEQSLRNVLEQEIPVKQQSKFRFFTIEEAI